MAEFNAVWVTTVLAADAQLDVGLGLAAFFDSDLDQLANTSLIKCGKGVLLEDLVLGVGSCPCHHG